MKYLLIALVLVVISSCSTERKLQRAINKHGQKESAEYVSTHYREYFDFTTPVPLIVHDTVTVSVPADSLARDNVRIEVDSSLVVENESLLLTVKRLAADLFNVKAQSKPKVIQVPVAVDVPQQPQPTLTPCPECETCPKEQKWKDWAILGLILVILGGVVTWLFKK